VFAFNDNRLDRTVAAAYGWPRTAATEQPNATNQRLLARNSGITASEQAYAPF